MKFLKRIFKRQEKVPCPKVTLPFDAEIKKIQEDYLFAFLIFLIIAAFSTYFYSKEVVHKNELVEVLVFSQNFSDPKEIEKSDVHAEKFSRKKITETTIFDFEEIMGKTLIRPVVKNEILQLHHFQDAVDPESVSSEFNEFFAFAMDESWFVAKVPNIKKNDLIDILVSNPTYNLDQTTTVASAIKVLSVTDQKGKTIVVNLTETDAQKILFARGLKLPMNILVRPSVAEVEFN
ncbi:MAG: GerMN domain-containing protein [Candidatus Peregrinibacteria bacterium]|nr:GerMN domain-containing protein [Candidatus Peregrinibacteria bacterium]